MANKKPSASNGADLNINDMEIEAYFRPPGYNNVVLTQEIWEKRFEKGLLIVLLFCFFFLF